MMIPNRFLFRKLAILALAAVWGWGCGSAEYLVEIQALDPSAEPLPDLDVTVLPFDHVGLLDSLALAAPVARPSFAELERQFESYRPPTLDALRSDDSEWQAIRDSVQHLADSLNAADRNTPTYARAYQRFGALYRRYTQRTAERDARLRDQLGEHRELAVHATAAADSLRAWEQAAFGQYPALAESAIVRSGRTVYDATTGDDGIARVALEPGRWWVTARWRDPTNPYLEYSWNTAMVVGRFGPRRVPLLPATAQRQWRH